MSLVGVSVQQYDGIAEYLKEPPPAYFHPGEDDSWQVWLSHYETGRIVVDRKTFQQDHYQASVAKKSPELLDKTLLPPFVYGYSCSRKQWCRFFLPHLRQTEWKEDAFDNLVLPAAQKSLIEALVSSHRFPKNARDQTQQKGKGLVCLLHGPPGSGKTLTAECAAELTQRALFSTSMSELNKYNEPWYFEQCLSEVLRLATEWKAVVLLDEADVFLESRRDDTPDAATRNALVAVFLRHLEYFSGIVFLTTNRIHVFDAAMKSRVHLALGYGLPDQESRRQIWKQNLAKLPAGQCDASITNNLDQLAAEQLNGREIANSINTACTLARFKSEKLRLEHVEMVLGVRNDFEMTLKRIRVSKISSGSKHGHTGAAIVRSGSVLSEEPEDMAT